MGAPPIVDTSTEVEPETPSLGLVIFSRIMAIERTRLQTKCLQLLRATSLWDHLVFRGGVAIHGVHLHGRSSRDLDFLAPAAIQTRFVELMAEQGVALQWREEDRIPSFPMQGSVFKEIAVGIDVCPREATDMTWEHALFQGVGGTTVPVRVMPLPLLIAEKFRAITYRSCASDFYDVWLLSQKRPDILPELQRLVRYGEVDGERLWFNEHLAWQNFLQLREKWHDGLIPLMPQVPSFETVEHDLARTLELFAGH